jgi:hypothetical protein
MRVNSRKFYQISDVDIIIRMTSSLTNFAMIMLSISMLLLIAIYLISNRHEPASVSINPLIDSAVEPPGNTGPALEGPIVFRQGNQLAVYYSCDGQPYSRAYPSDSQFEILCDGSHYYSVYANSTKPLTQIKTANNVTVISHINGDKLKLDSILLELGIVDQAGNWRYGDNHLVLLGNIVNAHGSNYELLWRIYNLEYAAKKAGGDLHYLHGLQEQYLLESSDRNHIPVSTEIASTPFAYTFDVDTVLGQWLRSKNTMMQVNNHLLTYAQPSKELLNLGLSIEQINENLYEYWQHQYVTSTLDFILNENGPTKHIANESDYKNKSVAAQMKQLEINSWVSSQGRTPMRSKPNYSITIIQQRQNDSQTNDADVLHLLGDQISYGQNNRQAFD